jgi:hypothetical protein
MAPRQRLSVQQQLIAALEAI